MNELYQRIADDSEYERSVSVDTRSNIQEFFAGKTIFLTGATGFMGKCFVEKILRDCPDLKRLYVLVRPKKGFTLEDKMKRYFSNIIFDRLRRLQPQFEERVTTISGDLQEDRLGISPEDRQLLIDNVDIMVHNGATVKFTEIVSVAMKINALGTKHMLDLAMECKHLLSFIYVSTAYSHCYNKHIEEKFYESPGDLNTVRDMIIADEAAKGGLSEEALNMLTGKWPNVYTFTKSIAEDLVRQYGEKANFACAVYRPTIVSAAYEEPLVGWIGNQNGPALAFQATAMGVIHACYYNEEPFDVIPVDFSINALIGVIYNAPERWKVEKRPVVYNLGSSTVNPVRISDMFRTLMEEGQYIGSTKTLWHAFVVFTDRMWLFMLCHLFFHFIPAVLADIVLICIGYKPRALQIFFFASKHLHRINYFINGAWQIHIPEMLKVYDGLNERDKQLFNFDPRPLDWSEWLYRYMRGARIYIMKEPLDNIPQAVRHFNFMKRLHYTTATVFFLAIAYYVLRLLTCLINAIIF